MGKIRPPGPAGLEKLRNIFLYGKDPFGFFERIIRRYGSIVLSESLGFSFYIISSPEDIEHVLVRNARNYRKDHFLRSWKLVFGEGLLTSEGEMWRRERRMVQPSFHRERLKLYGQLMVARTVATVDRWTSQKGQLVISAGREMTALTLDIVVRALFGTELSPEIERTVGESLEECGRYFIFTGQPIGQLMAKLPLPIRSRYKKAVARLDRLMYDLIASRRATPPELRSDDLLTTLIAARDEDGSTLTETQIRDELLTLFLAGHDTTALALTYALYLLGKNPEIQRRARAQIREVRGNGPFTPEHLEKAGLLRKIVQETLRLHPPAWVIAREAIEADSLSGYPIPAHSGVVIPIHAIHRRSEYFERPEEFMPDRWTEEFTAKLPRAAYLPFSFGPRMCIGSAFALMEAQLALAGILDRFEIQTLSPDQIHCKPSITAKPLEEVRLKLSPVPY